MKKMKLIKYSFLIAFFVAALVSCRDESLSPIPVFETGVSGFAAFDTAKHSTVNNFSLSAPTKASTGLFRWLSLDNANTVNKIEYYVTFDESYTDKDGNSRTANHGGSSGKLIKTISGSDVPANRIFTPFSITQADVYNLYKANTFDYKDGRGVASVFDKPLDASRTATNRFTSNDGFRLLWTLYTADGRKFDTWSASICGNTPDFLNCEVDWNVVK